MLQGYHQASTFVMGININVVNRPGVAGAVLQTPLSFFTSESVILFFKIFNTP